jgi:hypothetical protein
MRFGVGCSLTFNLSVSPRVPPKVRPMRLLRRSSTAGGCLRHVMQLVATPGYFAILFLIRA